MDVKKITQTERLIFSSVLRLGEQCITIFKAIEKGFVRRMFSSCSKIL